MKTILEATLLVKVEPATNKCELEKQLDQAADILLEIESLLESIYCKGGQYHRDGFVVEFEEV